MRTIVVTDATASTAARSTTDGTADEKSLVLLSASSFVSSSLPTSTCAASEALPTAWRTTLRTSWGRAADQTNRKAPASKRGRYLRFRSTLGW